MQTTTTASTSAAPVASPVSNFVIDTAHSEVGFRVRHMMVSWTKGRFDKYEGTLELDEQDLSKSKLNVTIDASSINTGTVDRDNHLRSADFFDAANFPKLTFVSQRFEPGKDGTFRVLGELTIRGVSKAIALDVEEFSGEHKDPWGNVKRGARAHAKLNRKDFGLNWNAAIEMGGVVVGDAVEITLEVELTKK
ncbi:MAG: protein yceI precursor [Archangium gephyra]|uniref:Protein yceI n=1 Tax=Archangium gephyra TaxID=48 RepID=A0A2W5VVD3_9BACT|nr:MAG: protein yceI precursor [Archangium gephyra]